MDFLREQAEKLIQSRKFHLRWTQVFIILSLVLILILEPILGNDGIAMTREAHEHNDMCYTWERQLVCEIPESDEHTHTEECYTLVRGELVCGKEEVTEAEIAAETASEEVAEAAPEMAAEDIGQSHTKPRHLLLLVATDCGKGEDG